MVIAILCTLAALGTCQRFSREHPTSRDVTLPTAQSVRAVFAGVTPDRIRVGMMAGVSVRGDSQKYVGRVVSVVNGSEGLVVDAVFEKPLPSASLARMSLVVDTTIPPELLRE